MQSQEASPHHVVFIADPQLVDPHTYPDREWPLSSLTIFYTDLYMSRSHSMLERKLRPDTLFFLGDLFDGGREWATASSTSPELMYREYGDEYWLHEYDRFSKIFFDRWKEGDGPESSPRGRRIIASLPGNHDIGFGNGIQEPVHRRFQAFFGDGNRVDAIGNHSFVSVDTISLSSMERGPDENIWGSANRFLNGVKERKRRVEREEIRSLSRGHGPAYHPHGDKDAATAKDQLTPDFPAILLSHVPLYRPSDTPCGPLRERFPPAPSNPEWDALNAIRISEGYQYQNVLTPMITNELISKVGPNIAHIYSGDDHDYCEISHSELSGSPREITVKSLSWAMGVRKPGFLMTSLWNPIDLDTGKPIQGAAGGVNPTVQNHLCLLPDQLSIFIRYAYVLASTIILLLVHAVPLAFYPSEIAVDNPQPLLPLSHKRSVASSSSTNSSPARMHSRIASRGSTSFFSRIPGLASTPSSSTPQPHEDPNDANQKGRARSRTQTQIDFRRAASFWGRVAVAVREFVLSLMRVAGIALAWYLWLIWWW